ncbi:MAG: chlorite dismutase family protein [Thermoplasmataceae archaeon]
MSFDTVGHGSLVDENRDIIYMQVICFKISEENWKKQKEIIEIFRELNKLPEKIPDLIHTKIYRSLRHDTDFIIWMSSKDPVSIRDGMETIYSDVGHLGHTSFNLLSIYVKSPYLKNASHIEEDLKKKGMKYFVCYPMSKTPEWYLIDYNDRKKIMDEHIKTAMSHPMNTGIISYTTYSFSIADQEFAVLYEVDSLYKWMKIAEKLREVEARKWISKEEPVFTGILLE